MGKITIELDQNEVNSLSSLLDTATRAGGLQAARPALHFVVKLEQAVAEENARMAAGKPTELEGVKANG